MPTTRYAYAAFTVEPCEGLRGCIRAEKLTSVEIEPRTDVRKYTKAEKKQRRVDEVRIINKARLDIFDAVIVRIYTTDSLFDINKYRTKKLQSTKRIYGPRKSKGAFMVRPNGRDGIIYIPSAWLYSTLRQESVV